MHERLQELCRAGRCRSVDGWRESPDARGRKYDVQLNIVPMIDVLSVLVSFLLITAVWTNVSRIGVKQQESGSEGERAPAVAALRIQIKRSGVTVIDGERVLEVMSTAELDSVLMGLRQKYESVVVASDDDVAYQELIRVMDRCLMAGLGQISVAP